MTKESEVTISAGRSRHQVTKPLALVIFGASGDLTARKLMPAIYSLFCQKLIPETCAVIGFARTVKSDRQFRDEMRDALNQFSRIKPIDEQAWAKFAPMLSYMAAQYDDPGAYAELKRGLEGLGGEGQTPRDCLFYMSTPPEMFSVVAGHLNESGLARQGVDSHSWSRIVVEKPFGTDLDSARTLNSQLQKAFSERNIYRIDHYLGKETVQNLLILRFANGIFEPIWNQKYVDHVQITVGETIGVGRRGKYYDHSGALRDMVQNHIMNLLCLVAMESPTSLAADSIRNEKVKVLRSLQPIPPDCAAFGVVRAQYAEGTSDGEPVKGYLSEDGVAGDSLTETYVAMKAHVDNWRWSGVPFYIRTGKCLAQRISEVSIHFKSVPQVLFNSPPYGPMQPNVLSIRIQPDEGISIQFQVKAPGPAMRIHPYQMDFSYADSFGASPPDAYERLLLDAALGDSTLFIRGDEIEAAWAFVSPILEGCDLVPRKRLPTYPAGSWGPAEAEDLIAAEGNRWYIARKNHG